MMAKVVVVSGIVAVLGITSMVAGFAAEPTRIKVTITPKKFIIFP